VHRHRIWWRSTQIGVGKPARTWDEAEFIGGALLVELKVHDRGPPVDRTVKVLHSFPIEFGDAPGRCFITTDAQKLRQLTTRWVKRALRTRSLSADRDGLGARQPAAPADAPPLASSGPLPEPSARQTPERPRLPSAHERPERWAGSPSGLLVSERR
jgi:hypothetical protein